VSTLLLVRAATELYSSDAHDSSTFELQIYAQRPKPLSDDRIGETEDTVNSLLAEGMAGGMFSFCHPRNLTDLLSLAVTRKLKKTDKKRTLHLDSVVEFTITAASATSATPVTAEAHMTEEVNNAEEAEQQMHSHGAGALGDLTSITSNIISVVELWQPLLNNIELFMNVMDKVAEVWHSFLQVAFAECDCGCLCLGPSLREDGVEHSRSHSKGMFQL
jgi:hypothetical protein